MDKVLYEVRVRERVGPEKWVKKSKFYKASKPKEAVECYKGTGHIMWVEKAPKDKLWGIGDFFTLGDSILRDISKGGDADDNPELAKRLGDKQKRRERRFYATKKREATC